MNRVTVMILALALFANVTARAALAPTTSARSFSGQIEAYAPALPYVRSQPGLSDSAIVLEPDLLVVSCERIKQSLWRKLEARSTWRGKILVSLHPVQSGNGMVAILSEKGPGGWNYRVSMPDVMETNRFVRAIVQVLLMEIANRHAGMHPAEVPSWLAEGLAQELMSDSGAELLVERPTKKEQSGMIINRTSVDQWPTNSLAQAKKILSARPPLTFEQLSWPGEESASGENSEIYRGSAQLFVNRLLALKNGPACMRSMLDQLPRRYNWQFAFFDGFQNWFKQSLDVEKWWALQLVEFSGRDLTQTWTVDESWKKLDGIFRSPIEVRTRPGELPLRAEVTLQTIIREWNREQQAEILSGKLRELDIVRLRISQDLIGLVDDYRQVLGAYLEKRKPTRSFTFLFRRRADASPDSLALDAIRNLDLLDARRDALRPAPPASVTAAAGAETGPSPR